MMHIICPECHTEYSLNDAFSNNPSAKVRCVKCRHVWQPRFVEEPETTTSADDNKWLMAEAVDSVKNTSEIIPEGQPVSGTPFDAEPHNTIEAFSFDSAYETEDASENQDIEPDINIESEDMPIPESVMNFNLDTNDSLAEKKIFSLKMSAKKIVILAFILTVGTGLWFGRFSLTETFPALGSVYGLFGIDAKIPGLGLEFQNVSQKMIIEDDVNMLEISGNVFNPTEKSKPLPPIKVGLLDASGHEIQEQAETLPVTEIAPKASVPFIVKISSPSAVASNIEITFVKE